MRWLLLSFSLALSCTSYAQSTALDRYVALRAYGFEDPLLRIKSAGGYVISDANDSWWAGTNEGLENQRICLLAGGPYRPLDRIRDTFSDENAISISDINSSETRSLVQFLTAIVPPSRKCRIRLVFSSPTAKKLAVVWNPETSTWPKKAQLYYSSTGSVDKVAVTELESLSIPALNKDVSKLVRWLDTLEEGVSIESVGEVGAVYSYNGSLFICPWQESGESCAGGEGRRIADPKVVLSSLEERGLNEKLLNASPNAIQTNWDEIVRRSVFDRTYWKQYFKVRPSITVSSSRF